MQTQSGFARQRQAGRPEGVGNVRLEVIEAFLAGDFGFAVDAPRLRELPDFVTPSPEGWVRILPGLLEAEGGLDGFFMARLVRMR